MSTPKGFNRLDRPELHDGGDKVAKFKQATDGLIRYREAFFAAQQAGVPLEGFPHPDEVPPDFDAAAAVEALGQARAKLRGVPPTDLRA